MSLTDTYNRRFYVCLPHQPRSAEWIEHILHGLWNYGMTFPSYQFNGQQPLSWQDMLASTNVETTPQETFREQFSQLAQKGGYLSVAYNAGWASLNFNTQKHASLDWLMLSFRGAELEPYWRRKDPLDESPAEYLVAYQAFVEWSRVLCTIVEPLFGFGYYERYLSDFDQQYEYVNVKGETPRREWLPEVDQWFSHPPLRYLAPSLLTPERTVELLAHTGWQIERLATGGLFVVPPDPEYTSLASGGYAFLTRGLQQQGTLSEQESTALIQRALDIFTALDERNGMHLAQTYLNN